ncbi:TPA: DUF1642 domain-containing protein [Streptococcus suis]
MNKQEAIEAIKNIDTLNINDIIAGQKVDMVIKNQVLDLINQIHEPQKVVVPKFVAEWIEELKKSHSNLAWVWEVYPNEPKIKNWLESNTETFMRAWLDGFEIEQEKLYEVTVPGTSNYKNQRQHLVKQGKHWFFCGNDVNRFKYRFTKGQIEAAGFGWVFDCKGVKVVEVEEN